MNTLKKLMLGGLAALAVAAAIFLPSAFAGQEQTGVAFVTNGDPQLRPVRFNSLSSRFELKWVAGARGKPSLNADIDSTTEAVREIANPDFEVLGTNATSALSTFYAEGGITETTAGADGDAQIILPHLAANQSAWKQITWGTGKQVEWECDLSTGAAITNITIWAGLKLTNTATTATDDDQCFFRFTPATNSGKWQALYSIAGTDTAVDSGVTVVLSSRYYFKIIIDSSRIARMYINGALVATSTALTSVNLIPYIGVSATGAAAAKSISVHGQSISRVIG